MVNVRVSPVRVSIELRLELQNKLISQSRSSLEVAVLKVAFRNASQ